MQYFSFNLGLYPSDESQLKVYFPIDNLETK